MSTEADKEAPTPQEESQNTTEVPKSEEPQTTTEETTEQPANEEAPAATATDEGPPIVLVTGASGFLASHIVQQLLQQGRYRVRGTVRDKNREDKVKPLNELPAASHPLELVAADLNKEDTWTDAVKGCTYVLHVASPFPRLSKQPKNPDVVIRPAVDGALNVLKACAGSGSVKRVVLTSSTMAISGGLGGEPGKVYTEEDWATEESCKGAYERSKFRAEKAAWEFVEKLEAGKKFELVTVNPCAVLGPFISASSGDSSASLVADVLANKLPGIPNISFPIVDVRDVAAAHLAAMESPEAAGNRYIAHNKTLAYSEIAAIISREFKPQGYKVPTKPIKKIMLGVLSKFNSGAKFAAKNEGSDIQFSNDKMKSQLGIEPRSAETTIIDQCYTLVDLGLVKRKPGYLGHPNTRPKEEPKAADEKATEPVESKTEESEPKTEEPASDETKAEEPASEEAKAEEPAAGEPKSEEPAVEEPKAEEPAAEEPKAEEPAAEEPKAEEPAVEEPKAEEPAAEEPKAEEPTAEEPKAEEPAAEEPKAEEPAPEEPKAEEPAVEEPKADEPPAEEPKAEEPVADEEPAAEEPAAEEPKAEEPVAEEPKAEELAPEEPEAEPPVEEPKAEEPPAEEPKAEEPPAEEPKAEEPPAEEPKAEEPVAEEPKAEEPPAEEAKAEEPPAEEPKAEEQPAEEPKAEEPVADEEPAAEEPKAEEPAAVEESEEAETENSES